MKGYRAELIAEQLERVGASIDCFFPEVPSGDYGPLATDPFEELDP